MFFKTALNSQVKKKIDFQKLYTQWTQQNPITQYDHWKNNIDKQMSTNQPIVCYNCNLYQPTSGSHGDRKWIPYNKYFLKQLEEAYSPWLADIYHQFPKTRLGKHYWSLSWLPKDLRNKMTNDDKQLFSFLRKCILSPIMAIPSNLNLAESSEAAQFATALYLLKTKNLTLISVWSPTFFLELLQIIQRQWKPLIQTLLSGHWPSQYCNDLKVIKCPKDKPRALEIIDYNRLYPENKIFELIWPNLSLISCWTSSSSKLWSEKLKIIFPNVSLQGKGLWATEAVVTIPFKNHYPLAINSHFYEFLHHKNNEILLAHQLKPNQIVSPIVSMGNGIKRYLLNDRLKVIGFFKETPCLEFLCRGSGTDLVGEKVETIHAIKLVERAQKLFNVKALCLLAINKSPKPYYALLIEKPDSIEIENHILIHKEKCEKPLLKLHHYSLAKELKQLDDFEIIIKEDPLSWLKQNSQVNISGDYKMENLMVINVR
jgi:hypothetical protein